MVRSDAPGTLPVQGVAFLARPSPSGANDRRRAMATKKHLKIAEAANAEMRDKLEADLHALRGEDDFGGGLPVVGRYPEFKDRQLSEFELDLRDWGFVYGSRSASRCETTRSCLTRTPRGSRSGRRIPSLRPGAGRSVERRAAPATSGARGPWQHGSGVPGYTSNTTAGRSGRTAARPASRRGERVMAATLGRAGVWRPTLEIRRERAPGPQERRTEAR
jgi:hypothetical protein